MIYELSKMTTVEAEKVLSNVNVAIIPVGSTEQHGGNMTMDTDIQLAYKVSTKIAERMKGKLVVLPPISVGISYHHMDFAGSMTLSPNTLQAIIFDYVKSLKKHGVKNFIIINGHGGNQSTLSTAVTVARYELDVNIANVFYFNLANSEISLKFNTKRYHACEVEASFGLYLDPSIVREENLQAGEVLEYPIRYTEFENSNRVDYPYAWKELTKDGSFGNARLANKKNGQEIIEIILERLEIFIEDFIKKGEK